MKKIQKEKGMGLERHVPAGKGKCLLAGVLAAVMLFSGCAVSSGDNSSISLGDSGQDNGKEEGNQHTEKAMGRYLEEEVCGEDDMVPLDMFCTDSGLYLARDYGMDLMVDPDTLDMEPAEVSEAVFEALMERAGSVLSMATAENGARMLSVFNMGEAADSYRYEKYFLSPEGELTEWKDYTGEQESAQMWYGGDGFFYVAGWRQTDTYEDISSMLYRVDAQTGGTEYLWEVPAMITRLSLCGDYLFAMNSGELFLYSVSTKEQLSRDNVLMDALKGSMTEGAAVGADSYLIIPSETSDCIYVLTRDGLYRHVMYGAAMERLIDGSLCSIGDITKQYTALCAVKEKEGELPMFFLAFMDGRVVRYRFHDDVAAVPETTLRVYSLYQDNNLRQAVSGYQSKHPELYVQYDVGIRDESGITRQDALKNLATELALGSGPDVLLMDGIPYDSYLEKGVLADLTQTNAFAGQNEYFDNVLEHFYREGKLYAVPMVFNLPVLMGDKEKIAGVESLKSLAALLEETPVEDKARIGLLLERNILSMLGQTACGNWIGQDGTLDREKVSDFLSQCERIYRTDRADMSQETLEEYLEDLAGARWGYTGGTEVINFKSRQMYASNSLLVNDMTEIPYSVGSLGGDAVLGLNELLALLKSRNMDYRLLSDGGNSCVPSSLLALNNKSKDRDHAEDFLEYALSTEFQAGAVLDGVPINKDALYAMEENPYKDEDGNPDTEPYTYMYLSMGDVAVGIPVEWASKEELDTFNDCLEGLDSVSFCDQMVYETVLELGASALNGEKSIEETVDEIEKKIQLYLAE